MCTPYPLPDPDQTNLDIYGDEPIPWTRALKQLEAGAATRSWLATTWPDGHPHIAGVGAQWLEGRLYFTSGAGTRKSRNLAENPTCAISIALTDLDLVVEGTAARVTDEATLARLAERYAAQGWPATVGEGAINHAALLHGDGMVLVEAERPDDLHGSHTGRGWVYLAVDGLNAHYRRAKAAGAEVLNEPHDAMDGAQRGYSARDLEGNLWSFGTAKPTR